MIFIRNSGKLCFATLQDGDGTQLQAMISLAKVGQDALDAWKADVDIGDIVYVHGEVISSRRGELSVLADTWQMASKSLRPLPVAYKEMNEESRVRQRYVDLIVRPQARAVARLRVAVVRAIRPGWRRAVFSRSKHRCCRLWPAARRPGRSLPTPTPSTSTYTCGSRRNCSSSAASSGL
ncbi:OB-fold nucleic acid binding domain protein [Mycobacterium xenopi 3993]|nr:OB-fold nucleic acid binding domain protein [Mycobacterium xenopi 3993]